MHYGNSHDGYALVRKGQDSFTMSGDTDDIVGIRAARRSIDGDFLWFRRNGKAFVLRDAALLARAEKAWEGTQVHEATMRALETRMQPHRQKLEALDARMERMLPNFEQTPEMRDAERAMQTLAERQQALAERQRALAQQSVRANHAERERLDRQVQQLDAQQDALNREFERHSALLEARHERLRGDNERMQAISREMETASMPMEAIGEQMQAVGEQIEREAALADRQMRRLLDDAVRQGLAQPAPVRR